jgi:hypothetical protein
MHRQKKHPKKFSRLGDTSQRQQSPSKQTHKALIETLSYKAIFSAAVTRYQLWTFLLSEKNVQDSEFILTLEKLLQAGLLARKGVKPTLYALAESRCADYKENFETSRRLMKKAAATAKYLRKIPWVRMITVTGSTAAFNSNKESDVDLLIVSSKNRLWLTRLFVVLVLKSLNVYWKEKSPTGTICPNIFLTEDNLVWPKTKRSVYTANEIALMCPIFYKNNVYFKFIAQNSWVSDFLPNLQESIDNSKAFFKLKKSENRRVTGSPLITMLEKTAMLIEKRYMRKKITKEIVNKNFIHFNKNDHTAKILEAFHTKLLLH